jgi:hypothetical protein
MYHCDIAPSKIINPKTVPDYIQEDAICCMDSSDNFFKNVVQGPLAISFIDGDHNYEQARKDFFNMARITVDNGYILLHDTYPPGPDWIHENACGDVYKLRQEIEHDRMNYDCITLPKGCVIGVGLTIVRVLPKERPHYQL